MRPSQILDPFWTRTATPTDFHANVAKTVAAFLLQSLLSATQVMTGTLKTKCIEYHITNYPLHRSQDAMPQTDDWRFDSGFVTDLTVMPVKTMVYQHLLDGNEAKMAFGPLQLYGRKSFPKESCAKLR